MPTTVELEAYADQLAPLYRDILAAFPDIDPHRCAGEGLAFPTISIHLANRGIERSFHEVEAACRRLADEEFFEIKNKMFAHPTELGEQLIAIVARRPPAKALTLPPLPARTW